ncbi:MAG: septal ring lytic transglycosylase RlpA family protein [Rhodocyclaceae bacterium]|nr:septal ring lytic transglycosylase RlpA family protein [Rhodocyclaceae bacterium]
MNCPVWHRGSGIRLAVLAVFLSACGTQAPKPVLDRTEGPPAAVPASAPAAKPAPAKPPAWVLKRGGGYYQDDGPGENPPEDIDAIPDAVPKAEPLHRFANNPYSVLGRDYTPWKELRPYRARGVGSWYGRKFHGQKTSSGEHYDMYGMTAAHATLPIPSYVRVTNPANGKSVVLRVNDRGPFHAGRIIDLSFTAAWKLGYVGNGSTVVDVEAILPEGGTALAKAESAAEPDPIARLATEPLPAEPPPARPAAEPRGTWLQLAAFGNPDNAEAFRGHIARELDWLADRVGTQVAGRLVRVQVGPYRDRGEAEADMARIRAALGTAPTVVVR